MTVTGPRVKDFTGDPTRFTVEVISAPGLELLMSLFTHGAMQDDSLSDFAVGREWFDGVRSQASPDLLTTLDRLKGTAEIWIELAATALSLPDHSTDSLVRHLRTMDPVEMRRQLIVDGSMHCSEDVDPALRTAAASGDESAIAELETTGGCKISSGMRSLLTMEAAAARNLIVHAIEGFDAELFDAAEVSAILERDADHKRAMARTMAAPQLVETATNGITFQMQPDVEGVVLIPSIVIRPWVAIGAWDRKRFFCYPVAEQHLTADPDSPPAHLVDVYKALGDERRLRLLRILAEAPSMSLAEVTEKIGLAKSTVHHHLSILRQAGFVLITLGSDKEYSLRRDAIPEAADLLAGFLTTKE